MLSNLLISSLYPSSGIALFMAKLALASMTVSEMRSLFANRTRRDGLVGLRKMTR